VAAGRDRGAPESDFRVIVERCRAERSRCGVDSAHERVRGAAQSRSRRACCLVLGTVDSAKHAQSFRRQRTTQIVTRELDPARSAVVWCCLRERLQQSGAPLRPRVGGAPVPADQAERCISSPRSI
jgi:hypothetical protein